MTPNAVSYIDNIRDFFNNSPVDYVICGGDWLTEHKQSIAVKDLAWIDGIMNKTFQKSYYPVYGNHDNNYQGELDNTSDRSANDGALSNQQMINLWFRKYGKMYYSFMGSNTKFYVFDTGIDWVTAMDSYKWEQVEWFAGCLLSNTDEHIALVLHIVTISGSIFGQNVTPIADNILTVADAFNNRTSLTLNGQTYDFSESQGTVHVALCGHTHYDAESVINGIPVYCIRDAKSGAFDAILIDYGNDVLHSVRVGSGVNRELSIL
jgi:predicted phosphodiesterase